MTDSGTLRTQAIATQAPATSAATQSQPSAGEIVPIIAANFSLVRPVGMDKQTATEWLTVAANEVQGIPLPVLRQAAAEARKTCTHHGQIVPAILGSFSVRSHQRHQQEMKRLARDGHEVPGYAAIERRSGVKQIGEVKALAAPIITPEELAAMKGLK